MHGLTWRGHCGGFEPTCVSGLALSWIVVGGGLVGLPRRVRGCGRTNYLPALLGRGKDFVRSLEPSEAICLITPGSHLPIEIHSQNRAPLLLRARGSLDADRPLLSIQEVLPRRSQPSPSREPRRTR